MKKKFKSLFPTGLKLPKSLDDVNPAFMTQLLHRQGVIAKINEVIFIREQDVGMTVGSHQNEPPLGSTSYRHGNLFALVD